MSSKPVAFIWHSLTIGGNDVVLCCVCDTISRVTHIALLLTSLPLWRAWPRTLAVSVYTWRASWPLEGRQHWVQLTQQQTVSSCGGLAGNVLSVRTPCWDTDLQLIWLSHCTIKGTYLCSVLARVVHSLSAELDSSTAHESTPPISFRCS